MVTYFVFAERTKSSRVTSSFSNLKFQKYSNFASFFGSILEGLSVSYDLFLVVAEPVKVQAPPKPPRYCVFIEKITKKYRFLTVLSLIVNMGRSNWLHHMPRSFLSASEFLSNPKGRRAQGMWVKKVFRKNSALNPFFPDVVTVSVSHGGIVTLTVGFRSRHCLATNVKRGIPCNKYISICVFLRSAGPILYSSGIF